MQAIKQKIMENNVAKWARAKVAAVGALALVGANTAMAAVPADITSAISDMKDDGVTVATAFVVAIIAVAAIKFLGRAK